MKKYILSTLFIIGGTGGIAYAMEESGSRADVLLRKLSTIAPIYEAPIYKAMKSDNTDEVKQLLVAGADPDTAGTEKGTTLLMLGVSNRNAELVKLLLAAGVDPNKTDSQGTTPFMIAAMRDADNIAKILLDAGASPYIKSDDAKTVISQFLIPGMKYVPLSGLTYSVFHPEVFKELIEKGANPNPHDEEGRTALMQAIKYTPENVPQILNILLEEGTTILDLRDSAGKTALIQQIEKRGETFLKSKVKSNVELIHEIVKQLVEAGVDVNIQAKNSNTALMLAVALKDLAIVKELLKAKINLDIQDVGGRTALILAVATNNKQIVEELINAGADTTKKDTSGKTALQLAEGYQNEEIIKLLKG